MLKTTPLLKAHQAQNAMLVNFAGWQMPLNYGSQLQEHAAVRQQAGMFDVSHMGIVDISGQQVRDFLRHLLANDIAKLNTAYQALYSVMLNENAGIIDDLIAYRIEENFYRLIINAACHDKDLAWIQKIAKNFDVTITPQPHLAIIAVQGPKAMAITQTVFQSLFHFTIPEMRPFHGCAFSHGMLARTGYTGEDGFEIIIEAALAEKLWMHLLENGAKPCGLAARDSLRIEAGLNLYGQDMDETISPFEANIAWTLDWRDEKREFIGKSALINLQTKPHAQLTGLILNERGMLRQGQKIFHENEMIGEITSSSFSSLIGKAIAFARIKNGEISEAQVDVRGKLLPVSIVKLPFVRRGKIVYQLKSGVHS